MTPRDAKGGRVSRFTGGQTYKAWAPKWKSRNQLDGLTEYLATEAVTSLRLFRSRADCRAYIQEMYGYIKHRRDLRTEPHGWRVPKAVRVRVTISEEV